MLSIARQGALMLFGRGRSATYPDDLPPSYFPPLASDPPPPPPRRDRTFWRVAAVLLALFLAVVAWLVVTAPLSRSLQPIAAPGLTILSADGKPIARRGAVTDDPVDVTQLPDHVGQAFIAIEDRRFYNHMGIDPWGIIRAMMKNLSAGGLREGGSTITQQLAKLAFLSNDRTPGRKAQEAIMAVWLEAWLSKDEILSRYMSSAYFGDNAYGLRAASKHYFSREPETLTLEQATMLAGLVQAPSRLAPTRNLKGARARGETVAAAMVDAGFLTEREADRLPTVRLKVRKGEDIPTGTYFADWVFDEARASTEGGYGEQSVRTTLDDDIQRAAVAAVRSAGLGKAQVALVAMRPDGRVVAMVGGKSYKDSPFNRATQAKRQPGSTFKLFVYLAAMRAGMSPQAIVEDTPVSVLGWTPRNSSGTYRGPITIRDAFTYSSNVATVRLSERVGRQEVIDAARDLGVTSQLTGEPSIALGTSGVPLIEMTAAYAAIRAGVYPVKAHGIVAEEEGGWFSNFMSRPSRLGERNQRMMLDMLWQAANTGTGRAARLGVDTFGKTGTSQENRDALFIGFAGDLVAGVWVGNDDNSPLGGVQGGGLPARIWKAFMSRAVPGASAAPRRVAVPAPEPRGESPLGNLIDNIRIPVGDSGVDVGVDMDTGDVTVDASGRRPAAPPEERPVELAPPPPGRGPDEEG